MAMIRSALLRRSGALRSAAGQCHFSTGQGTDTVVKTLMQNLKAIGKEVVRRYWEPLYPPEKMLLLMSTGCVLWMVESDIRCEALLAEHLKRHAAVNGDGKQ